MLWGVRRPGAVVRRHDVAAPSRTARSWVSALRGGVPHRGGGGVAPHDLEGDDGGQQERALQDLDDLLWDADLGGSDWPACSMPAQTTAAIAMPPGLLRPSRATEMPVNPMAVGKVSPYLCSSGSQERTEADEAGDRAAEIMIVFRIMALRVHAARPGRRAGLTPVVRSSKPKRVRQTTT